MDFIFFKSAQYLRIFKMLKCTRRRQSQNLQRRVNLRISLIFKYTTEHNFLRHVAGIETIFFEIIYFVVVEKKKIHLFKTIHTVYFNRLRTSSIYRPFLRLLTVLYVIMKYTDRCNKKIIGFHKIRIFLAMFYCCGNIIKLLGVKYFLNLWNVEYYTLLFDFMGIYAIFLRKRKTLLFVRDE